MTRRSSNEDVELNVTAMLDMAFQLLAFFVLTFKPPPGEDQIYLKLPPAKIVLGGGAQNAGADETKDAKDIKPTKSVIINLLDENGDGRLATVQIGDPSVPPLENIPFESLKDKLRMFFRAKDAGDSGDQKAMGNYEQLVVQASPTLPWETVMKVADLCAQFSTIKEDKLPSISFISLGEDPGK